MNVLAIDTSQPTGSVALSVAGAEAVSALFGTAASHLVEMSEALERLLNDTGLAIRDVDRVAVVIGPGSFTGLRIGLSYVKGLCAARAVDVVTVKSLELLAAPFVAEDTPVCVMVDARKSEVYGAVYGVGGDVLPQVVGDPPHAVSPTDFLAANRNRKMLFVGSGVRRYATAVREVFGRDARLAPREGDQPSTPLLCRMAPRLPALDRRDLRDLEPFYIRASDAKLSPLRRMQVHEERQARSDE